MHIGNTITHGHGINVIDTISYVELCLHFMFVAKFEYICRSIYTQFSVTICTCKQRVASCGNWIRIAFCCSYLFVSNTIRCEYWWRVWTQTCRKPFTPYVEKERQTVTHMNGDRRVKCVYCRVTSRRQCGKTVNKTRRMPKPFWFYCLHLFTSFAHQLN